MILHTLTIGNWRCVLDDVTIGPFSDGLNVLYGPNGTGKSTLFEALRRLLFDTHSVAGREMEAVQPWGRDLAPRSTAEFAHGGIEYRVSKQFLKDKSALLERREEGVFRKLAEGRAADDQVRALFTHTAPGRGLAKAEHWGIAQVLWAPQGNLAFDTVSGEAATALRTALNAQMADTASGPLEERIAQLYTRYFTQGGKARRGADASSLVRLEEELNKAQSAQAEARARYEAFDEATRQMEDLLARQRQAQADEAEQRRYLATIRAEADKYRALLADQEKECERERATGAEYKAYQQRLEQIGTSDHDLTLAQKQIETIAAELPLREREREEREKELTRRRAELEDARKGREVVEQAEQDASDARRLADAARDIGHLDELLGKIREVEQLARTCRENRAALVAPDSALLRRVRKAMKERDEARIRLEAAFITLEIVPCADGAAEVIAGETPGPIALRQDIPAVVMGTPEVTVDLPGIARIRARGPVVSAEEHRHAIDKADTTLATLTGPFGTADIGALEQLVEQAEERDRAIAEADTRLATLLDGREPDDLLRQQAQMKAISDALFDKHPTWVGHLPDAAALAVHAIEVRQAFIKCVEACETAWDKAQEAQSAADSQWETLRRQLQDTQAHADKLQTRLSELTGDGMTVEEREHARNKLAAAWHASTERLKEVEEHLAGFEGDPVATLERLEQQLSLAAEQAARLREEEARASGRLEHLAASGPYSALAAAEERCVKLEEDLRREQDRAEAVKLLHDTVAACKAETIAAIAGPVERYATRLLQRVAGRRLGMVRLSEGFAPGNVAPESGDSQVSLDNLSGGEQEQVYLVTRLALAQMLANDERQLVVLDDVLTATDAGRHARVMSLLEEGAEHLQILILTCHPERYAALRDATRFDLHPLLHPEHHPDR